MTVIDDRPGFPVRQHILDVLGDTGWDAAELPGLLVNEHQVPCACLRLCEQIELVNEDPGADFPLLVRHCTVPDVLQAYLHPHFL